MKRADDFEVRRKHIAELTDEELYQRFWELTDQVVDPLLELGRKNTTPANREPRDGSRPDGQGLRTLRL